MVAMDEGVFLVFVPFGLAIAAVALFVVRHWEANLCWERFRLSTVLWTTMTTLIVAGFVNMSDWWPLLAAWILFSGFLGLSVVRPPGDLTRNQQLLWLLLILTPGGWFLFFTRFPHLHAIDAEAFRANYSASLPSKP
jgi:hypothetical protein